MLDRSKESSDLLLRVLKSGCCSVQGSRRTVILEILGFEQALGCEVYV